MKIIRNNIKDIRTLPFWKAVGAECIGTLVLVLLSCGSALPWNPNTYTPSIVQIALTFGFSVGTMIWAIGHVSGGHINPVVTAAMVATGKVTIIRGLLYIVAQCVGGILGAAILFGLTPSYARGNLGATFLSPGVTPGQGFGVEFLISFILVLTVFSSCDNKREDLKGSAPLTIGLSVAACHLFAIKYTQSGMNCARSLGPAIMTGIWEHHWVYWIGPLGGGVCAGLMYEFVFAVETQPLPRYRRRTKMAEPAVQEKSNGEMVDIVVADLQTKDADANGDATEHKDEAAVHIQ